MLKQAAMRLAQFDQHIRGDRWRPLVRWGYRAMAPIYDVGARLLLPDYQLAAIDLLERLEVTSDDCVLDLGCGTGMVTLPAAAKAARVAGLDMTPGMLRRLQRKAAQQPGRPPALIQGDARYLPLVHETFSVVATSFMLLHLTTAEKQQVFSEVRRILVPGGRLGCLTGRHTVGDAYPTPEEWRGWLQACGFHNVTVEDLRDVYHLVLATRPQANE
jgi:ubiquinone/menaquinone biosynthesis C-methylase UbiE